MASKSLASKKGGTRKSKRGVDKDGKPLSSYWKAKLEAEERQREISELRAEVERLRGIVGEGGARTEAKAPAAKAPASQDAPAEPSTGDSSGRVGELEDALRESKQRLAERKAAHDELVGKLQKDLQAFKETVRTAEADRDHARSELQRIQKKIDALQSEAAARGDAEGPGSIEGFPTVRQLLAWFGIPLNPRVIATGHTGTARLDIELRDEDVARVITLDSGTSRVYDVVSLDSPADQLLQVFLPYRRYYELQTEARVIDACRLLGRPLALDRAGRANR